VQLDPQSQGADLVLSQHSPLGSRCAAVRRKSLDFNDEALAQSVGRIPDYIFDINFFLQRDRILTNGPLLRTIEPGR
jgi:hypothetical protein